MFAADVGTVWMKLQHRRDSGRELSSQVVTAAMSAAASAEEAEDGSSCRDFVAKERICLRELKATRFQLRVLRASGLLDATADRLIAENQELVRIVGTIVRQAGRQTVES